MERLMKKLPLLMLLAAVTLTAAQRDPYRNDCVRCHRKLPVTLDKFFFNYLLKYSSEREVKAALYSFLRHPTKKKALASEELIRQYGLMPPSRLSDTDLRRAIDTYWETYKVFGKIK